MARKQCWGENKKGQLGQNDNITRGKRETDMGDALPIVPLGIFEAESIVCGDEFSCAIDGGGVAKCWGYNFFGQLGLGDNDTRGGLNEVSEMGENLRAVDVGTGETIVAMGLGASHTCAVLDGGALKCWGLNEGGQLGLGDMVNRGDDPGEMGDNLEYVDLGVNVTVSSVALGARHTCAVVGDGGVKCWGNNDGGQLGYEDRDPRGTRADPWEMGDGLPLVDLGREQRAITVAAGAYHSCALLYTGDVKCWGFGASGQLGQGSNSSIGTSVGSMGDNLPAIDLGTGRTAVAIAPGGAHTCAVLDDETIKCWGGNDVGTLGLGDTTARGILPGEMGDNLPAVNLTFGAGGGAVSNAFAGTFHTCVSGTVGGLACFGANVVGQLGAGTAEDLGNDPGEIEALTAISLGPDAVVMVPAAPGTGVALETISPTPAPVVTPSPIAPVVPATRRPVATPTPPPSQKGEVPDATEIPTPIPVGSPPDVDPADVGDTDSGDDGSPLVTAAIASAAILVPVIALVVFVCCWRRRKQQRRQMKGALPAGAGVRSLAVGGDRRGYGRGASGHSSGNGSEIIGDNLAYAEQVAKGHEALSTAPMDGNSPVLAGESAQTPNSSGEGLPRPGPMAAAAVGVGVAVAVAAAAVRADGQSDDDDSSRDTPSEVEEPSELRRSGSNSSISTLGSTSTASSTWPSDGFVTPARTDIPRGGGGARYGGRGKGHGMAVGGVDGLPAGLRSSASSLEGATPSRTVPDTPSPRSASSSVHGTPHPPEMRLAQFARASAMGGDSALYGLPEMEVGRSASTVFDSNTNNTPGWPIASSTNGVGNGKATALGSTSATAVDSANANANTSSTAAAATAAASAAAATAAAATILTSTGIEGAGSPSSDDMAGSPTMGPTLTPARFRNRADDSRDPLLPGGGAGSAGVFGGGDGEGRTRRSIRSSRSSAGSPPPVGVGAWAEREEGGGVFGSEGMGAEAAAQAFTEEAELEALQIDKNDLKLVFGRPFARGKSSEVYQVTHAGKNRAAKIIDLFSLGVVGDEVTRLYASFAQELRAMKGIRHDCVAAVYGAVATPSELTIVTDLVKRGPLRSLLDDKVKSDNLTADTRHKIIKDVASGMAYLSSKGIQHRALHSHNVLITKEWGAKVSDFGLSRTTAVMLGAHDRAHGSSKKRTRSPRGGMLRWTAPELLRPSSDGSDPFTEASDVYSVGVIAWEVLCGGSKLPYDGLPDDKVASMILEGSTPPISMETPIAYSKLMLLCWRKKTSSRPSFSYMASVLIKDAPP